MLSNLWGIGEIANVAMYECAELSTVNACGGCGELALFASTNAPCTRRSDNNEQIKEYHDDGGDSSAIEAEPNDSPSNEWGKDSTMFVWQKRDRQDRQRFPWAVVSVLRAQGNG